MTTTTAQPHPCTAGCPEHQGSHKPVQALHQIAEPTIILTESDALLLDMASELLEQFAAKQHQRGNCSAAEGAECCAHAVQRLGVAMLAAQRDAQSAPAAVVVPSDAEIITALESAGVEFLQFMGGRDGKTPVHTTSGSQKASSVIAGCRALLAAAPPAQTQQPFGYVNTNTGQYFKDVDQCRKGNEGHWRTVYAAPQAAPAAQAVEPAVSMPKPEWWINYSPLTGSAFASGTQESELASSPLYTEQQVRALLAAPGPAAVAVPMSDELRGIIEGMSVSVDVSTCDQDAGHRYFGTVCEVMDDPHGKHGVTILVQDAAPNFAATPPAQAGEAIAEITSANHDAAEFGERGFRILRNFQHLDYGTKLYPHPAPQAQDGQRDAERWKAATRNMEINDVAVVVYDRYGNDRTVIGDEADAAIDAAIAASAAQGEA